MDTKTFAGSNVLNKYKLTFVCSCPSNNKTINYALEIYSDEMIFVESLLEFVSQIESGFHEQIADSLLKRFGGLQVLKAHHHGVDIETIRGGNVPKR